MEVDGLVQRGVITNWWEWWRNVAHLGFLLFPLLSNVSPSHTTSHQHYFKTFLALPKQLYRWTCHWLTDWLSLLKNTTRNLWPSFRVMPWQTQPSSTSPTTTTSTTTRQRQRERHLENIIKEWPHPKTLVTFETFDQSDKKDKDTIEEWS